MLALLITIDLYTAIGLWRVVHWRKMYMKEMFDLNLFEHAFALTLAVLTWPWLAYKVIKKLLNSNKISRGV